MAKKSLAEAKSCVPEWLVGFGLDAAAGGSVASESKGRDSKVGDYSAFVMLAWGQDDTIYVGADLV